MNLPAIVLGAGGHAKVLVDALRGLGTDIRGIVDADPAKHGQTLLDVPIIGDDRTVLASPTDSVLLVNGLGTVRASLQRRQIYESFKSKGYQFATVVHGSAIVAPDVTLGEGAQVMAGAVIQTGCRLGENTIVNTRAAIDHDCAIGSHAHISPGATLCGNVAVGEGTHIGAGATVIQGIRIGRNCTVAAGALVIRDIGDDVIVAGAPAREM